MKNDEIYPAQGKNPYLIIYHLALFPFQSNEYLCTYCFQRAHCYFFIVYTLPGIEYHILILTTASLVY